MGGPGVLDGGLNYGDHMRLTLKFEPHELSWVITSALEGISSLAEKAIRKELDRSTKKKK